MSVAVAADPLDREWDVFISYAREDSAWVKEHLYEPLRSCRTAARMRPTIFLDVSEEGIPPAWDWVAFLGLALQRSHYIVVAYTRTYFQKEMCRWELGKAFQLHPRGSGRLLPILVEPEAEREVPFELNHIHWLPVEPGWFERLCDGLNLTADQTTPALRFRNDISEITERHTLPAVEVAIVDQETDAVLPSADAVTIKAVGADVQGTLAVQAEEGIATFRDLSFAAAAPEVRLVAEAPGCERVTTPPFPVKPAVVPVELDGQPRRIAARGVPVFFADGQTVAVVGDGGIGVFAVDGTPVAQTRLSGRLRTWARGDSSIAFADWSGQIVLVDQAGHVRSFDLGSGMQALSVPGSLCFAGDRLHAGMWNGTVWSLSLDAPEPQRQFEHPAGVQVLAAAGDRWLVAGLDGNLTVYTPGGATEIHAFESLLLDMRAWADCVVAVGERKVHRLSLEAGKVLQQELPVGETAGALLNGSLAVVVDADGRGVRFDSELNIRGGFHIARGARPVGVDRAGNSVVFAYPDGSHVLMVDDRVVFSSSSGPLAISPDGVRVAINDGGAIRVASLSELGADATEPVAS